MAPTPAWSRNSACARRWTGWSGKPSRTFRASGAIAPTPTSSSSGPRARVSFGTSTFMSAPQAELRDHAGVGAIETRPVIGVIHLDRFHSVHAGQVDRESLARTILPGHP